MGGIPIGIPIHRARGSPVVMVIPASPRGGGGGGGSGGLASIKCRSHGCGFTQNQSGGKDTPARDPVSLGGGFGVQIGLHFQYQKFGFRVD